jgi:hypothetical protein
MRWPRRKRFPAPNPASLLPAPAEAPPTPPITPGSPPTLPPKPPSDRPKTLIELLSDLTLSARQAVIFLIIICVFMAMGTACVVVVADAIKGIKFGISGSLRAVLPAGIGIGTILSWLASRAWRRITGQSENPTKADRTDSPDP